MSRINNLSRMICCFIFMLLTAACTDSTQPPKLEIQFAGGYGQLEVGGRFAGVEFHKSRPLPSRISFYYPVANSLDLSTDYWKRYESLPLNLLLKSGTKIDSLGKIPYPYSYTPYHADFSNIESNLRINFSYDFCEDLPVIILKLNIKNISNEANDFELQSRLVPAIRSSHTYSVINPTHVQYNDNLAIAKAFFKDKAADSSLLFIANAGLKPIAFQNKRLSKDLVFNYHRQLAPAEEIEIIQLIGMCRINEHQMLIEKARNKWRQSVEKYQQRVSDYAFKQSFFNVDDPEIMQTVHWSKALIAANKHYLDGHFVPMPCPAEYNFFFTHDLLLTGLGAVYFDPGYVKQAFEYLGSLSRKDSILAHARYWKDDHFQTEFCNSDNWNHLWFIILASSYLKHSADIKTIRAIFPILKKSLNLMLQNMGSDGLMYAKRPDWWDIGNIYGARAYISILMYKALNDYVYLAEKLNVEQNKRTAYPALSQRIKSRLVEKLWDEKAGYLLNMMDDKTIDRHYYAGSILAVHYNLLDDEKKERLLATVARELLDEKIGVRNAMPNDFHELIHMYKFNGLEVGVPYVYFNGGVWPHNNIWYVLALNSNKNTEKAKTVLEKYMTINGIMNSPNGIPAFYEYRMTNPNSERYGEIDKPAFLWAAGFFMQAVYQVAGFFENSFNMGFRPNLPTGFENAGYDLSLFGTLCRIEWKGTGAFFKRITIDEKSSHSAIITSAAHHIVLERGHPLEPYLSDADCSINGVHYDSKTKILTVNLSGQTGQDVNLTIVSPLKMRQTTINNIPGKMPLKEVLFDGVFEYSMTYRLKQKDNTIEMSFF